MLDQEARSRIVWIDGPAGSGKTTVASAFLEDKGTPYSYYQVDDSDSDIASLFIFLKLAIQRSGFEVSSSLPVYSPDYNMGLVAFCRRFFLSLFSGLPPGFVLVFDNFQELPDDPQLREVFQVLLSELPDSMRIFLISRSEPIPDLAKYQLTGDLLRIGWKELRLTIEEAGGVIRSRSRSTPTGKLLDRLHEQSGGWMAGLILLAEGAEETAIKMDFSNVSVTELTFNYLSGELFQHFDPEKQQFLLKSALFSQMSVDMVSGLTGLDASRILPELIRDNYFIEAHPGEEVIYQYHPLFRRFLRVKAEEILAAEEMTGLCRRAAGIAEKQGWIDESLHLLLEIEDWPGMARILLQHANSLLEQAKWKTLGQWIEKLPLPEISRQPWLHYWFGISRLSTDPRQARYHFERAYTLLAAEAGPLELLQIVSGASETIFMEGSDFRLYDQSIDTIDQILKEYREELPEEAITQIAPTMFGAMVNRRPDHPDFDIWLDRTLGIMLNHPNEGLQVMAGFVLCAHYIYVGNFSAIGFVVDTLRQQMAGNKAHPLWINLIRLAAAGQCWLTGYPRQSLQETEAALEYAAEQGLHLWDGHFLGFGAGAALTAEAFDLAQDYLDRMSAAMIPGMNYTSAMFHCISSWRYLLTEDISRAEAHAESCLKLAEQLAATIPLAVSYQAMAICRYRRGNYAPAETAIRKSLELGVRTRSPLMRFQALCTLSAIQLDSGNTEAGMNNLQTAMSLGCEGNLMNFWIFLPELMTRLCLKALEAKFEIDYVRRLISFRRLYPEHSPIAVENWPWQVRFFTLGAFRIEIGGNELRFRGKPPRKPLEMLRLIVTLGGRDIKESRITDFLWPDAEGDAGHNSFETTLHRLRKLIGVNDCIQMNQGRISLNPFICHIDYQQFELIEQQLAETPGACVSEHDTLNEVSLLEKGIDLYRGHYFCTESWALALREHLRRNFVRLVLRLGNLLESRGENWKASDIYMKGLRIDDSVEEFHRNLILCYLSQGLDAEAEKSFQSCIQVMAHHGLHVSEEMNALRHRLNIPD